MTLGELTALLRRHDLFSTLDNVRLEVLAFTAERPTFNAGDTLFEAGDEAEAAYFILKGQAVMLAHVGYETSKGEARALRLDRGDLVGEAALFATGIRRSTVRAATPLETLCISRGLFHRLLDEFPEMAGAILEALSRRIEQTAEDMDRAVLDMGRKTDIKTETKINRGMETKKS